jgi:hypothetical protein
MGQLFVNGVPFHMKGVCWNPVPKGGKHPADLAWHRFAASDAAMMKEAGINVMRSYEPIYDTTLLDVFYEHGIYVVNSAYSTGDATVQSAIDVVTATKDHPAILMWSVGNEWNYNGIYSNLGFWEARGRVAEVVAAIKAHDTTHPVSTIYGELPDGDTLNILHQVDVWGINSYRDISFYDLFSVWESRSDKPMYLGEFGADAWDARRGGRLNLTAQAHATTVLTQEIIDNSAKNGGSCIGGFIFEFADEWWKDYWGKGPDVHDVGGIAPGGGPYPDKTFNEEYWGIVDIDRNPRPAFEAYKAMRNP